MCFLKILVFLSICFCYSTTFAQPSPEELSIDSYIIEETHVAKKMVCNFSNFTKDPHKLIGLSPFWMNYIGSVSELAESTCTTLSDTENPINFMYSFTRRGLAGCSNHTYIKLPPILNLNPIRLSRKNNTLAFVYYDVSHTIYLCPEVLKPKYSSPNSLLFSGAIISQAAHVEQHKALFDIIGTRNFYDFNLECHAQAIKILSLFFENSKNTNKKELFMDRKVAESCSYDKEMEELGVELY